MKGCITGALVIVVIFLAVAVLILWMRDPGMRNVFLVFTPTVGPAAESPSSEGEVRDTVPKQSLTIDRSEENGGQMSTATTSPPKPDGFNQYWDADKAFAVDELFAVTSKNTIRREFYTDHFDKNPFGNPTTKFHEPVYIVRAMGRETRENYLFVVTREFYDAAKIYQKFTKTELSNFEYFLSEDKLQEKIFHRRFRDRMID